LKTFAYLNNRGDSKGQRQRRNPFPSHACGTRVARGVSGANVGSFACRLAYFIRPLLSWG
jgi:hypothetical protein